MMRNNDRPGTSYGGKHGDMAYAAAFIMHTVPMLTDLDAFSWWTISDIFEEGWLGGAPFYGTYEYLHLAYRVFASYTIVVYVEPFPTAELLIFYYGHALKHFE